MHALEAAGQEAAVPLAGGDRLHLAAPPVRGEHDEPGQVLGLGADAVPDPGAGRRPAGDLRARVHERVGGVVVDLLGLHRAHDADVVGDGADVGEQRRDLLARAGPSAGTGAAGPKQRSGRPWSWAMGWPLVNDSGMGSPSICAQLRLVVEQLEVRRAAGLVEVDDALRARRDVRARQHAAPAVDAAQSRFGSASAARASAPRPVRRPAQEGATREALPHRPRSSVRISSMGPRATNA